ncbi:hypothetical protein SOVF_066720 [Spinacia oleracea]|uniref:Uncharacterized protein n=1 Tax=Spinacia oleracea TaxID=3562 RepID=A0A9R0ICT9_SPIOL|nr:uncharacterized protein LOC110786429 [Spinacia oleracea]KNA18871.1 hypothetical protein SOVF_066720 [Spinacia oleracea]
MAYNHPYGNNYYGVEREVIRDGPCGAYAADYRVDEYGNRIYHHRNGLGNDVTEIVTDVIPGHLNHHHHHPRNGLGNVVTEVVTDVIPGHYHHQRHHPGFIQRREECIVDSAYDPYRRMY